MSGCGVIGRPLAALSVIDARMRLVLIFFFLAFDFDCFDGRRSPF
jgi:hypothetical protein